jgi:hypothetical protein
MITAFSFRFENPYFSEHSLIDPITSKEGAFLTRDLKFILRNILYRKKIEMEFTSNAEKDKNYDDDCIQKFRLRLIQKTFSKKLENNI